METSAITPSYQIPQWLILFLRFAERWMPGLSIWLVTKLFFRPIPFPTPEREMNFDETASKMDLEVNGKPFRVHRVGNGVKVLCIHGWSGRGTQFYELAPYLAENGCEVTAVTAPGHGPFPLKYTHMLEFADAMEKTWKELGPFDIGIAHSIGGTAIFNSWLRGLQFKGLVIMGTPSYLDKVIFDFCDRMGLKRNRTGKRMIRQFKKQFGEDFESYGTANLARKCNVPGLVIHDKNDIDVHWTQGKEIHDVWMGSKWLLTSGLGHRRILSNKNVIERIDQFIKEVTS